MLIDLAAGHVTFSFMDGFKIGRESFLSSGSSSYTN